MADRRTTLQFDALQIEGALLLPDVVAKIASEEAGGSTAESYGIPPGLKLRDEIGRSYQIGRALWQRFEMGRGGKNADLAYRQFGKDILTNVLGFRFDDGKSKLPATGYELLSAKRGRVPIAVAGMHGLDRAETVAVVGGSSVRRSPTTATQGELNSSDRALWGIATDGAHLRILRDSASLTRPALIEFDLDRIFRTDLYSDFTLFWLLGHESRFGGEDFPPSDCALEAWREEGRERGVAIRGRLRDSVEEALFELGSGILEHPANVALRNRLTNTAGVLLSKPDFFRQLLRLVYRLIFVMTAEDRDILFSPDATQGSKETYRNGYSLARLRERSRVKAAWDRHHDAFESAKIVFRSLGSGQPRLALPALGGLFDSDQTPDLTSASISNKRFLAALFNLGWLREPTGLVRINWRDMATEEFGSVYESLLELVPEIDDRATKFYFANGVGDTRESEITTNSGHSRKTTSSYYTKDALVEFLLDSALDPLIEKTVAENPGNPDALLRLTALDPACGSGHFILGAARRIAQRLADLRNPGAASIAEFRHALREVVANCIYGVDQNELAVELCRVALWIEAVEPGKPLTFLDARIQHGNSLIGVADLKLLEKGIPDAAYSTLQDDDKDTASFYRSLNKGQRNEDGKNKNQQTFSFAGAPRGLLEAVSALERMPQDDVDQVHAKAEQFAEFHDSAEWKRLKLACDLFVAPFFLPKEQPVPRLPQEGTIPTTDDVWLCLRGSSVRPDLAERASRTADSVQAFHWPLMFPEVFLARGGFDIVLGNPPWDTMSPDVKEFFSPYDPEVRFLAPSDQSCRVEELRKLPGVDDAWQRYCRSLYEAARFMKESGRFTLFAEGNLGKGDFNVYRMFTELALRSTRPSGHASQFVPENLYNGANAAAIRAFMFDHTELKQIVGFENTKRVWFDIDTRAKFCMYVAQPGGRTSSFAAAFGTNSQKKLQALAEGLPFNIPTSLVSEFSPDALAVAEVAHQSDIDISRKIYSAFPKFGEGWSNPEFRPYSRELDMGNDRETFGNDPEGVPVYEGRMVEAFDHRAKAYSSGRGRKAVWFDLAFGSPAKKIASQWRVSESEIPGKLGDRWRHVRAGFCDVASPTNQRALVASLIPPDTICGDKVPTVVLEDRDPRSLLFWLAVANSFAMDFVVRKKVALKMSFTLVDSLPLPKRYEETPVLREIAKRSLKLAATGPELRAFWEQVAPTLGMDASEEFPCEDEVERRKLKNELDTLVARDVFGLSEMEIRYVMDPADVLGEDCGFETFGALKRAEIKEHGSFLTRDAIIAEWRDLPVPARDTYRATPTPERQAPALASLPDGSWTHPANPVDVNDVTILLAAILKRLSGPTPTWKIRMAFLCALEPRRLLPHLSTKEAAVWTRLVGAEAAPSKTKNLLAFAPRFDASWRDATTHMIGTKRIKEDLKARTWAAGSGLDALPTSGWTGGRAAFVWDAVKDISPDKLAADLSVEDQMWVGLRAA